MSAFTVETKIDAPAEEVWGALADIGSIHRWNPGVVSSYTMTDAAGGLGARRHCNLGGKTYLDEEVVEWRPGQRLTMRVIETNLPFKTADIRFTLRPENGGTVVAVTPDYTLKFGPLGSALDRLFVRNRYRKGMQALLTGLKRHVEHERRPHT